MKRVTAGVLDVAYLELGPACGQVVILLHGFPYDVHAFDAVATDLAGRDCRVIVPYLRGYGPTRFLSPDTMRSGEQAVLGTDLLAFMDALDVPQAMLAGYDWGGRAACVVAALWPERVSGLMSGTGYNIQDIASSGRPLPPETEHRLWYQSYLHSERGRAGLAQDRRGLLQVALATMVTRLDVRRRRLQPQRRLVRQSGFRGRGGALLPSSLRLGSE